MMDFNKTLKFLIESPYTKALSYFRIWCDENDQYIKDAKALFKYGRENKIPKNMIHEIADDMEIAVDMSQY